MTLRLAVVSLLVAALAAGCAAPPHGDGASSDPGANVLREADRAFAADTAARGLEGWMHWFTPGAVKLGMATEPSIGHAAIAESDAPMFADPAVRLTWEPDLSGWLEPGERGFTRGVWELARHGDGGAKTKLAGGHYFTLWVRTPEGWRCELDLGSSDG